MGASCAATESAGRSNGSLRGCTTSAASSLDGNITSRTSLASSTLPAYTCCSDMYETSSSLELILASWAESIAKSGAPPTPQIVNLASACDTSDYNSTGYDDKDD